MKYNLYWGKYPLKEGDLVLWRGTKLEPNQKPVIGTVREIKKRFFGLTNKYFVLIDDFGFPGKSDIKEFYERDLTRLYNLNLEDLIGEVTYPDSEDQVAH